MRVIDSAPLNFGILESFEIRDSVRDSRQYSYEARGCLYSNSYLFADCTTMRLLTHNLLSCHARTCLTTSKNFPLAFKDVKLEIVETDMNENFLRGLIGSGKIEWRGLVDTCRSVSEMRSAVV